MLLILWMTKPSFSTSNRFPIAFNLILSMRRESYCSTSIEPIGIDARRFANVPAQQSDATGAGDVYGFQRRSLRLTYLVCPRALA